MSPLNMDLRHAKIRIINSIQIQPWCSPASRTVSLDD
jgi:hypothetical protein